MTGLNNKSMNHKLDPSLQQYVSLHDEQLPLLTSNAPASLNELRSQAREMLNHVRLPRRGSDLAEWLAPDYGINLSRINFEVNIDDVFGCDVPNMSTCLYMVVNDILHSGRTAHNHIPAGVVVSSLSQAALTHPDLLEQYYGSVARLEDPTVALNTLLAQDGVFIYIPDDTVVDRPIQLVNVLNAARPTMVMRRVLVIVGQNSHVRLLSCDHTQQDGIEYLNSMVVEIVALEHSTIDYYDLEESSASTRRIAHITVDQREGSNVLIDGITLANGATRNTYHVAVNGRNANTQLLGMTIAGGRQHVDSHTKMIHNAPCCKSNEMFKYVLNDDAIGAFSGKILVQPHCPRVEAYQGNRNICASPTARMYTKPQLEIYTDDVKCSHGTTVGQLDEEALFYMRTRGVSLSEARTLLMQAFVADVIDAVRLDILRDRLRLLVEKRFNGTLSTCGNCHNCHN